MSKELIRKSFGATVRAANTDAPNEITVVASGIGDIDRGGDVIFPGAWAPALTGFLREGHVLPDHSWEFCESIAMPTAIMEQGRDLVSTAEFHTTATAQDARTICLERAAKGLTISVSVGYWPDYETGVLYFSTGQQLLDYAKGAGYDLSLFDTTGILAHPEEGLRAITRIAELTEWSLVVMGAHPRAKARLVKSVSGEGATTLAEHLDMALAAVKRASEVRALRIADGRDLAEDRKEQLRSIGSAIAELLADQAPDDSDDLRESRLRAQTLRYLNLRALTQGYGARKCN
jgi:hypothetical protein